MTGPQNPPVAPEAPDADDGLPPFAPDFIEQDYPEAIDDMVPTRGFSMQPMVGLGGSAGSINALLEIFKATAPDTGMAFIVVLHLSPVHESTLHSLLAATTLMPVTQVVHGQKVEPNHVYVIPPGKYLTTVNNHLHLIDLLPERGRRVAVEAREAAPDDRRPLVDERADAAVADEGELERAGFRRRRRFLGDGRAGGRDLGGAHRGASARCAPGRIAWGLMQSPSYRASGTPRTRWARGASA